MADPLRFGVSLLNFGLTEDTHYDNFRLVCQMKFGLSIKCFLNLALASVFPSLAAACAVCVTGAGNDSTADAYNWSVLFLMTAPYVVVGSVVGWLVYAYRRAAKRQERSQGTQPDIHLAWNQKESGR